MRFSMFETMRGLNPLMNIKFNASVTNAPPYKVFFFSFVVQV